VSPILVEPRLEKIVLPGLAPLSRPHGKENHDQSRRSICKETHAQAAKTGKYQYLQKPQNTNSNQKLLKSSRATAMNTWRAAVAVA
jgi:hypothetical protein